MITACEIMGGGGRGAGEELGGGARDRGGAGGVLLSKRSLGFRVQDFGCRV